MKKVLSLLIAMCMVLGMIPAANAEGIADYPVLEYGVETTITVSQSAYTYVTFTPASSGTYRFCGLGDYDTVCALYDAEMTQLAENDQCYESNHGHGSSNNNFCLTAELEGGVTYVLGAKLFRGSDADISVVGGCPHEYASAYDAQDTVIRCTCAVCADTYTLECLNMAFGTEMTVVSDGKDYPYLVFVPEESGAYRFYSVDETYHGARLRDANLDSVDTIYSNYPCYIEAHGHSAGEDFCVIAELEAGVAYILDLNAGDEDITVGVECGHDFSVELPEQTGDMILTCERCGLSCTDHCVILETGVSQTVVCEGNTYGREEYYVAYTAKNDGSYLFSSSGDADAYAEVYNIDMEHIRYLNSCNHYSESHDVGENFCASMYLEAGNTLILGIGAYEFYDKQVTVQVTCSHQWERTYSPETGLVVTTCVSCGESVTEECPALEYDVEMTLPCNGETDSFVTFTPEISGNYRFYGITDYPTTDAILYDDGMNPLEYGYNCWDGSHGHSTASNFCFTSELEAGVTYVLAVQLDASGWLSDTDVTIAVTCGHSYVSEVTREATCAQSGLMTHTCAICGHVYTEEIVVPHTFISEIINEGTCSEPGTIVHTCVVCDTAVTEDYVVAHDYDEGVVTVPATCYEDGYMVYTCKVCGHEDGSWIWASHNYVTESYQEGTCTELSVEIRTCTKCGGSYTSEGWYNHDYQEVVLKEPTCTDEGSYEERCTLCGDSYGPYHTDPLGHSYGDDLNCVECGQAAPTSGSWEHLSWTYTDGLLTVTGEGEMPEPIIIDAYYTEYINNAPWEGMPIRAVVIGEGITNVNPCLFSGCETLEQVTLSSTVVTIGTEAFRGCSALTEINLPEGLTTLEYAAFAGTAIREVHIPAGVQELNDAFSGCSELAFLSVDENNPDLCADEQGVVYSKDMTTLLFMPSGYEGTYVLPATVTELEAWFHDSLKLDTILVAEGNPKYHSEDGMLYRTRQYTSYEDHNDNLIYICVDNELIACPPAKQLGDYVVDAKVGRLSLYAFTNCVNLTELTIPATCRVNPQGYSNYAFGSEVEGCTALEAVWFEQGHPDCISDENGMVYNGSVCHPSFLGEDLKPGTVLCYVPAAREDAYLEIREGVEYIYANLNNPNLKAIRFPSTLIGLDSHILTNCTLDWIVFTGEYPFISEMIDAWAHHLTAEIYYPAWLSSWEQEGPWLDEYDSDVTYIPYEQGKAPVWGGENNPFTDVPYDSFYCEPVLWAVENGITNGLDADSFGPTATCNRAQVVTFLWRAMGCPEPKSTTHSFVDVAKGSFYEKPVLWAVENGITNGSDATHFGPTLDCNRAQVVTFMYRTFGSPAVNVEGLPFIDVPAGSWYEAPIAWAVENGITNGMDSTHFGPTGICNRAQVVTFLYRAFVD